MKRSHGGLGLGLSLCRGIADTLGAELAVDSEPGKGSEFRFGLELKVENS